MGEIARSAAPTLDDEQRLERAVAGAHGGRAGSQIVVVFAHGAAGNKDRLVAVATDVSQKV